MPEFNGRLRPATVPLEQSAVPAAGAETTLTTQVLVAVPLGFGIGSGAPKRQPVSEQLRRLPVWAEVAAERVKAPLTLLHDAATTVPDAELLAAVRTKALACFRADTAAPLRFEPSGEDFLSPTLMAADLMRRVLPAAEFGVWLAAYLPDLPTRVSDDWLPSADVADEADGRAVHLHGLNLSRAWNLANIAAALPAADPRTPALRAAAGRHGAAGLRATLATRHYAGDHWLPSFAVYLATVRSPPAT